MQDRHVTNCEIEASLGISSTSIHFILHVYLAVKRFILVGSRKI
uniref:Mariner transposase [Bombyx mori] n=1 Tax=Lepeophtheirus salmonis TaxID=72036 RepID=A0A0K2T6P4_LEPSM